MLFNGPDIFVLVLNQSEPASVGIYLLELGELSKAIKILSLAWLARTTKRLL